MKTRRDDQGASGNGERVDPGPAQEPTYTRPRMPTETAETAGQRLTRLRENIDRVVIGHDQAVDQLMRCLLARGHILIEDVPGVGKTVLATALARSIDCGFSRIQFTPDLLPSDVIGVSIYDRRTGAFEFKRGPIFTNIVLADEINRTSPRTQSALLEAMNEQTVSVEGQVLPIGAPFMVVATQNPYEFEGAYPLPESQLDRFLMQINLGYPTPEDEARVLDLRPAESELPDLAPVMHADDVIELQRQVDAVRFERPLVEYVVAIADATRRHDELSMGLSTRGALAIAQAARASALLEGRGYAIPEDVRENVIAVAAHRVLPASGRHADPAAAKDILSDIMQTLPSPD
jgi:MoxR-like ATPase